MSRYERGQSDLASRAMTAVEEHGTALLLVAGTLVTDVDQAQRVVAQVLCDSARRSGRGRQITRAEMCRLVYGRCDTSSGDPRVTLALCVYGGLSRREAAELLEVPETVVADHLLSRLRELAPRRADSSGTRESPAHRDRVQGST